jgi:hypothetical protein
MTTSNYMPDVQVEVAFDAGYATPAVSRTWTDVSQYVELRQGIDIKFGRQDQFAIADANTLKVVLDNADGRFTPGKASSPYYPNVLIGRPIRVKSTRVGGSASTRFLGFVDDWVLDPSGDTVTVTASSQLARAGSDTVFFDSIQASWTSLVSLFTLGEAALPAVDTKGLLPNLTTLVDGPVAWRGGLGIEGEGTALRMYGNSQIYFDLYPNGPLKVMPETLVFEFFFSAADLADDEMLEIDLVGTAYDYAGVSAGVGLLFAGMTTTLGNVTALVGDNNADLHHVAFVRTSTSLTMYLDGVEVDSDSFSPGTAYRNVSGLALWLNGANSTVDISYVAISSDVAGIPARALAGAPLALAGGGTASERIEAYAAYAGVESVDVDATTDELTAYALYGQSMADAMRAAEKTDGGVLFDAADGTLTYRDRESRYLSTSAFTLDASAQQIEGSVAPRLDRSTLVNEATVQQTDASDVLARARDEDSIAAYGVVRQSWEIQGDEDACLQAASWAVAVNGEPETRIPNLDVDLLPLSGAMQDSLLAATIGTRFTLSGLPSDFPSTSLDFFLEGYTESIGFESYRLALNVTRRDSAKWDVWTVEDATYGAYDSNPIAW